MTAMGPVSTAPPGSARPGPRGTRRWLLPAVIGAICVAGLVLEFGLGLPGIPVWVGVLAAEAVVLLTASRLDSAGTRAARTAGEPQAAPPPEDHGVTPPEPGEGWTAEIHWRDEGERAHFAVLARGPAGGAVELARSRTFDWPPPEPEAIARVSAEVDELRARMLADGWQLREHGSTWFADVFAWNGGAEAPEAPADEAPEPLAEDEPVPEHPVGPRAWPEGTEALARCEIRWAAGYRRARFEVAGMEPGRRRAAVVAASEPFAWTLRSEPRPDHPAQAGAVERLAADLLAAGWEEVRPGPRWYARRFVRRTDD